MKKLLFLVAMLVSCLGHMASAQSDGFWPFFFQPTRNYAIDTSSNAETTTVLLPFYLLEEEGGEKVNWQVALANISDTSTVTIYVQQSLDPAAESTARWVNTDTIVTNVTMIASGTKDYLYQSTSRANRMRLQIIYTGTGTAKVRTRVWSEVCRAQRASRP